MDSSRFDELTKAVATTTSRRQVLKTFAASIMGGIFGLSQTDLANAAGKCLGFGSKCAHGDQCCSGNCLNNKCICPSDQTNCSGTCVTCPVGGACLGTSCVCLNGQTNCNGVCKDLSIDPNNCGTCGHVCNATNGTAFCSAGACGISCNAGFGNCDGNLNNGCETNLQTDANNCGTCGHVCASGETCVNGACTCGSSDDCPTGHTCCSGMCVNEQNDSNNCGACNHVCAPGQRCSAGTCVCDSTSCPTGCCDGSGTCQSGTSNSACGTNGGTCVSCPMGQGCCGGTCMNLQADPNNCGFCGHVCNLPNAISACSNGNCVIAICNPGFGNCNGFPGDGCETNISNDANNFGACGHVCPPNFICFNGTCVCPNTLCNGVCCNPGCGCNFFTGNCNC